MQFSCTCVFFFLSFAIAQHLLVQRRPAEPRATGWEPQNALIYFFFRGRFSFFRFWQFLTKLFGYRGVLYVSFFSSSAPMCNTYACVGSGKVLVADASTTACRSIECSDSECCTTGCFCFVFVLFVRCCHLLAFENVDLMADLLFFCIKLFNAFVLVFFLPCLRFSFSFGFSVLQLECAKRFYARLVRLTLPMQLLFNAIPARAVKLNAVLLVFYVLNFCCLLFFSTVICFFHRLLFLSCLMLAICSCFISSHLITFWPAPTCSTFTDCPSVGRVLISAASTTVCAEAVCTSGECCATGMSSAS